MGPNVKRLGGAGIVYAGLSMMHETLSRSHFEGYALVLGAALVVQGALTLAVLGIRIIAQWQGR